MKIDWTSKSVLRAVSLVAGGIFSGLLYLLDQTENHTIVTVVFIFLLPGVLATFIFPGNPIYEGLSNEIPHNTHFILESIVLFGVNVAVYSIAAYFLIPKMIKRRMQ